MPTTGSAFVLHAGTLPQFVGPVKAPVPSCPSEFSPQHITAPLATTAHPCEPPIATAIAPATFCTCTGVALLVVDPFPSSPWPLGPQHRTVPSRSRTQLLVSPTAT